MLRISAFIFVVLAVLGCSTTEDIKTDTAEGAYAYAEKLHKDKRYEEAVTYYAEVKNKYPYSRLATEAELKIGDVNFERESYLEAETAYRVFKDLHPRHARIDYVTFRLGLSIFNQLPSTIDRDLQLAERALLYFDEVLRSHSKSEFAAESQTKRTETLKKLAEKEIYIADYYFKRKKFDSALGRYEDLLKKYPGLGFDARALYGATISALKNQEKDKLERYFSTLKKNHPASDELKRAQQEVDRN